MTEPITIRLQWVIQNPDHKHKLRIAFLYMLLAVPGILLNSIFLQLSMFALLVILTAGTVISDVGKDLGLTIEQARARLDEIEAANKGAKK